MNAGVQVRGHQLHVAVLWRALVSGVGVVCNIGGWHGAHGWDALLLYAQIAQGQIAAERVQDQC